MIDRRTSLAGLLGLSIAPALNARPLASNSNFSLSGTFMNSAYTHPLPLDAAAAAKAYLGRRTDPMAPAPEEQPQAKAKFARLINASPEEIAYVPSTSYGEDFVATALGLKTSEAGAIVSDILHFEGSLYMYGQLAKRGRPVTILPMEPDGSIDLNRVEAAVDKQTKLVALSLVSMVNGFQPDLKAICDIAHRAGAVVFVDAIQGAGAVPIDVRATNVDFLACSSFKWLMGDFGYGFLFARSDLIPRLRRDDFGYHQMADYGYHFLPGDPPGAALFEAVPDQRSAAGHFEIGSSAAAAQAAVDVSLGNILAAGVPSIQRSRQILMDRLRTRLAPRYRSLTPAGSTSPIISFVRPGAGASLRRAMVDARINIQLYENRFRISPSVFNTPADVDRVVDLLLA